MSGNDRPDRGEEDEAAEDRAGGKGGRERSSTFCVSQLIIIEAQICSISLTIILNASTKALSCTW